MVSYTEIMKALRMANDGDSRRHGSSPRLPALWKLSPNTLRTLLSRSRGVDGIVSRSIMPWLYEAANYIDSSIQTNQQNRSTCAQRKGFWLADDVILQEV